jgi:hypothetical protein
MVAYYCRFIAKLLLIIAVSLRSGSLLLPFYFRFVAHCRRLIADLLLIIAV